MINNKKTETPTNTRTTKQQQKSKQTRDKIFRSAKTILAKDGYEALSIKNICEKAGVSNGSFYHHFQTKDDLLSYYIEHQPSMDAYILDLPANATSAIDSIIQIYLNYATYCQELGVEFISNYYTPKNQALNPRSRTERAYPIIAVRDYIKKSIDAGRIQITCTLDEFTTDIRMLIIGNVFEWCLHNGKTDFTQNIKRSFHNYLSSVLK